MKFLALIVLVCVLSLAFGQSREQDLPRREREEDQPARQRDQDEGVMMNKRLLVEGKLGQARDQLDHNFNGILTNLKVGDLVLSHIATNVLPKGMKVPSGSERRDDDEDSFQQGVLFNTWIFSDKKSDRAKIFFLLRKNPQDLGICYRLDTDRSTPLRDWVKSNERCGQDNKGILYKFNYNAGEQTEFPVDMLATLCLVQDKIQNISGISRERDQDLSVVQAHVVDQLDNPDVSDASTFLDEFSLPFHCAVAARQLDVNTIKTTMKNIAAIRALREREEPISGSREREARQPLREDSSRVINKPVLGERDDLSFTDREQRKPIDKSKLNKPVEY